MTVTYSTFFKFIISPNFKVMFALPLANFILFILNTILNDGEYLPNKS